MDQEDRIILALLEATGGGEMDSETLAALQERSDEGRAYTELLGLIPRELAPTPPSPQTKERLMAAVSEQPASATEVVPLHAGRRQDEAHRRPRGTARKTSDRFRSFLVAAVVAFMMVGVSGWFYLQLQHQRDTVDQLQKELLATNLRLEELTAGRHDLVASLRDMGMMPAEPVMWCPLRPTGSEPPQPDAHGSLVLAMQHGRWSVRVHNLEPASAGQVYVLWFLKEDAAIKKVSLGRGDRPVQISATGLPGPMTAAAVTLETSMDADEPSGPRILYGHSREMDRL